MFGLRSARGQAILAGTVFVLLLVGMGALEAWRAREDERLHGTLAHTFAAATALESAQGEFWWAQGQLGGFVISGDPVFVEGYDQSFATAEQELAEARAELLATGKTAEVSALDDLVRRIDQFDQKISTTLDFVIQLDRQAALQFTTAAMSEMMTETDAIIRDWQGMVQEAKQDASTERDAAGRRAEVTLWLLLGLGGVALATGIGAVVMLVGSVVGPLAALRASANAIASGDSEARARVSGPEEVASLARDFNAMTDALAAKTEALRESEKRYRLLAENASDHVWTVDLGLRYTYVSPSVTRMRGYTVEEVLLGGVAQALTPASLEVAKKILAEELAEERTGPKNPLRSRSLDVEMNCKDGSTIWTEVSVTFLRDPDGQPVGILGVTRDISERKRAEETLRESEARYKALFAGIPEGMLVADLQTRQFRYANPAMCRMFGYTEEELLRMDIAAIQPKRSVDHALAEFEAQARGEKLLSPDIPCLRKDGTIFYADIRSITMVLDDRKCSVGIFSDITERKRAEQERERLHAELEVRAITDSLTGLYNHAHFFQRLAEEMERSKRYDSGFAVVMMDVDNFKRFNDSRGHQMGDKMLRLVADSIQSGLRRSDLAFRYGGDEFAAILPHADAARARAVIDRINRRLAKSLKQATDGAASRVSLSAGIACFADDGSTPDELVRVADTALYSAKWAAQARHVVGGEYAIESLAAPPGTPETGVLSTQASYLAAALHELGVPNVLAELNLRTVAALGTLALTKDPYIHGHQERTSDWAATVAEEMGLSPDRVRSTRLAGLLHDLGKAGISKRILNKPGKLTEEEFAEIKEHPLLGSMMIISEIEALQQVVPIVRHHHEHLDGKGYPDGLAGQDIPLEARILGVVDAFDAMTHERAYRKAMSREEALAKLEQGAGTQFDPAVVEAFLAMATREGAEPAARKQPASGDKELAAVPATKR